MVTKGALEEMLSVSTYVEYKGEIKRLTDEVRQEVLAEGSSVETSRTLCFGVLATNRLGRNDIFSVLKMNDT